MTMASADGTGPPPPERAPVQVELDVTPDLDGMRLDQFLASVLPGQSRSGAQRLIRSGLATIAGAPQRPRTAVRAGQRIQVTLPPAASAIPHPEEIPLLIVHEDADLVVVDKPAGMVVHPSAGHGAGTLVNALLHHIRDLSGVGGEQRPGIVHRLDRGTSGLLVAAKHDAAHRELARQFHDREVEKTYTALVWGLMQAGRRIEAAIGRDPHHRQKMSTRARRSRAAVTRVTRAEPLRSVTLVEATIATGRTHQIRVHLSAVGHPIVGDAAYGGIRRHLPAHLRAIGRLDRPFLHASRLAFKHPADGRRMEFTSPLPRDLQEVLDDLQRPR
jgi:23S rRNA pseudouridine1911/1915/1917 synthase